MTVNFFSAIEMIRGNNVTTPANFYGLSCCNLQQLATGLRQLAAALPPRLPYWAGR